MKILIINSNTTEAVTEIIVNNASKASSLDIEITGVTADWGPATIEGHLDALLAANATAELIARYESDFDGFIIACGVDPGLLAAWELTAKPVVGISEAAMLMACALSYRFAILTPQLRLVEVFRSLAGQYGLGTRLTSVYPVNTSVAAIAADQAAAFPAFLTAARQAVADGAGAICLGGATLSGMDKALQQELKVPVLDGITCSVHLLKSLINLGVGPSKIGPFAPPEQKRAIGVNQSLGRWYTIS